jgi:hypothetical protein
LVFGQAMVYTIDDFEVTLMWVNMHKGEFTRTIMR